MGRFNKIRIVGLAFAAITVITLAAPTLRWLYLQRPDGTLYGYTDAIPQRPEKFASAFFNKSIQQWAERYFDANLGFRKSLILTFNEINFRLFRESPRLRLYTTPANGLYSQMSLDSLNDEVSRKDVLEKRYREEAEKLLRVQQLLASQGKDFQVLIATSKPYVYPDGLGRRYLIGGSNDIFARAASFGDILRATGVNVVDGGPLLREFAARTGIETHPRSGVHWNYYAGCLAARQMFENVRARHIVAAPLLDCGTPTPGQPHMVDVDGLRLLNIWTTGGIAQPTPYPEPTIGKSQNPDSRLPNLVFISDSFSDQVRYSLQQAHAYSRLVNSGYFRVREIDDPLHGITTTPDVNADETTVRQQIAGDIAQSNVVVLEMVDYNIQRWDYGFADYLLDFASRGGSVEIASTSGAYPRESDGPNWWNWVQHKVAFKLQPAFVSSQASHSTLRFEYSARGKQDLVVRVHTLGGSSQQFAIRSQGDSPERFESVIDLPPTQLDKITIETDGRASAIGAHDPRIAALMIRNLTVQPSRPATAQ